MAGIHEAGSYKKAIELAKKALVLNPENIDAACFIIYLKVIIIKNYRF